MESHLPYRLTHSDGSDHLDPRRRAPTAGRPRASFWLTALLLLPLANATAMWLLMGAGTVAWPVPLLAGAALLVLDERVLLALAVRQRVERVTRTVVTALVASVAVAWVAGGLILVVNLLIASLDCPEGAYECPL